MSGYDWICPRQGYLLPTAISTGRCQQESEDLTLKILNKRRKNTLNCSKMFRTKRIRAIASNSLPASGCYGCSRPDGAACDPARTWTTPWRSALQWYITWLVAQDTWTYQSNKSSFRLYNPFTPHVPVWLLANSRNFTWLLSTVHMLSPKPRTPRNAGRSAPWSNGLA